MIQIETIQQKILELKDSLIRDSGQVLVIDFNELSIEIAWCATAPGALSLLAFDEAEIGQNQKQNVPSFISQFIERHQIDEKNILITISDSASFHLKQLSLPLLPEREITKAAKWQLKDEVTFDLEDAVLAWQPIRVFSDEKGAKRQDLTFILVQKKIIQQYISCVLDCGLNPLSISNSCFDFSYLLGELPHAAANCAILNIEKNDSLLTFYLDHKVCFMRRLPISTEKMIRALMGTLVSEKGKISLTRTQADDILEAMGIPLSEYGPVTAGLDSSRFMSLMRPLLEALTREVKFSFEYFSSRFQMKKIDQLYVTGRGASVKNLDHYIEKELSLTVDRLGLPSSLKLESEGKPWSLKKQNQMTKVISAVLSRGRAVNLLPREQRLKRTKDIQKIVLRLMAISSTAIFLMMFFMIRIQIRDYQNRVKMAEMHLKTVGRINDLTKDIFAKQQLIELIRGPTVPAEGVLRALSDLTPAEIILREIDLDQNSQMLRIKGVITSSDEQAQGILFNFIRGLEESLFFIEASLTSAQRTGLVQEFEISCDLISRMP